MRADRLVRRIGIPRSLLRIALKFNRTALVNGYYMSLKDPTSIFNLWVLIDAHPPLVGGLG